MLDLKNLPIELIYGLIAVGGGIARYLNAYVNGQRFHFSIFVASTVVAGFSGFMFALLGETLNLPQTMIHVMAGVGGFCGDQTLKLIMEYTQKKII